MGQYYYVVNLDKKEYLHPHRFDEGLKLMEFGQSSGGTMLALAVLLADGNGREGGDITSDEPLVGSWAGDRIVIAGDYADADKFIKEITDKEKDDNLHTYSARNFEDISDKIINVLKTANEWKI